MHGVGGGFSGTSQPDVARQLVHAGSRRTLLAGPRIQPQAGGAWVSASASGFWPQGCCSCVVVQAEQQGRDGFSQPPWSQPPLYITREDTITRGNTFTSHCSPGTPGHPLRQGTIPCHGHQASKKRQGTQSGPRREGTQEGSVTSSSSLGLFPPSFRPGVGSETVLVALVDNRCLKLGREPC